MTWSTCWQPTPAITNTSNDSTVIDFYRGLITSPAESGATSIGMDECGDLAGPHWGHIPGDIPGVKKMTLAAEGFRQGKAAHPNLFVAAWNPGTSGEPDGVFSGLMKDGTFDLAMFEAYTVYPPAYGPPPSADISAWFPRMEFARKEGWLNRSIPCLGMLFAESELNPTGWTKPHLKATIQQLKARFPEMPGVGFYGHPPGNASAVKFVVDLSDTATLDLIRYASQLSKKMFPDQGPR